MVCFQSSATHEGNMGEVNLLMNCELVTPLGFCLWNLKNNRVKMMMLCFTQELWRSTAWFFNLTFTLSVCVSAVHISNTVWVDILFAVISSVWVDMSFCPENCWGTTPCLMCFAREQPFFTVYTKSCWSKCREHTLNLVNPILQKLCNSKSRYHPLW
jgi:hypothetical protein